MTLENRITTLTISSIVGCCAFLGGIDFQQVEIDRKDVEIRRLETSLKAKEEIVEQYKASVRQNMKDISDLAEQNRQLEIELEGKKAAASPVPAGEGEVFTATAYTQGGHTATGFNLSGHSWESAMVVAVDPSIIPLGSQVYIEFEGAWAPYSGIYTASDTGGAVRGNVIDVFVGHGEDGLAHQFGRRNVRVSVL